MRLIYAGIFHLAMVSAVLAQANGDVESIGFDHAYRPGTWTPMVVRLTPTSGAAFKGKIAIYQEDADHDIPIFTRPISLRGNAEGGGDKTQRFWMYFIPQPDLVRDGNDPLAVNRKLRVYLTTDDSPPRQLTRLLVKDNIDEVDDANRARSTKLVLCVTDQSRPIFSPYAQTRAVIGLKESVLPVMIPIANVRNLLPESVLGYDAVDAVVWCDADPGQLSPEQRVALEEYVRRGGKLVVCQSGKPNTWEMVKRGFATLLPVDVAGIESTDDLAALKRIVKERLDFAPPDRAKSVVWKDVGKGPYEYAVGRPRAGAVVAETDEADGVGRPWMVRGTFGSGSVTWVAQDLGEVNLSGRSAVAANSSSNEDFKWLYVWDRVLDWGNASQPLAAENTQYNFGEGSRKQYQDRYGEASNSYHLTRSFLSGMEFPGTGAAYLGLAILFFIIYWVAAGPGGYLYLASKKKSGKSWFVFAASALVATGFTVIVVKMTLRGSAQIHHVSFVRMTPGEPTVVHSQFGLYIKRDGGQRVELMKTAQDAVSYVTAYPSLTTSDEGAPPIDYEVPVFDAKAVSFYYRSTLKKLQAKWVGDLPQGVEGSTRISAVDARALEGKLTNKTGRKLKNVYFVFRPRFLHQPDVSSAEYRDQVLNVPSWDIDEAIDLAAEYKKASKQFAPNSGTTSRASLDLPGQLVIQSFYCESYWYRQFQHDTAFEDKGNVPANFVMLSLYDHLPAPGHEANVQDRWDLHRAALRDLDLSGPLAAGRLIVLAQSEADTALPIPVEVEGDAVAGEGTTYYQFILPLDRSAVKNVDKPATKPATKPVVILPSADSPGEGRSCVDENGEWKMEDGGISWPSSIFHSRSSQAANPHPNPPPEYRRRGHADDLALFIPRLP